MIQVCWILSLPLAPELSRCSTFVCCLGGHNCFIRISPSSCGLWRAQRLTLVHGSTTPYTKTDVLQMVVREYVQQVRHKPWSSQEFTRLNVNLSSIAPDLNPCSISGTMDMLHVYWDTARGYLPMSELYAFTDPGSGPWALEMNLTMPSSLQPCQIEMSTGW